MACFQCTRLISDQYTFEEGLGFHLPCPQYREGKCATFHQRPRVCVRYQCELLQHCLEGQANWDESLAIVTQARTMLDALRAQMPGGSATPITFDMLRQVTRPGIDNTRPV